MSYALVAEWTKLRTTRSSAWLPILMVLLTIAFTATITALTGPDTTACADGCDLTKLSLSGIYLGQAVAIVFGAIVIGSEYGTGLISVTLVVDPCRSRVLAAKAVVIAAACCAAGVLAVMGSMVIGRVLLTSNAFTAAAGYPPISLADSSTLRAAAGTVLYFVLVALFSFGVTAILRDTATALTMVLGLCYLMPVLARLIGDEHWRQNIERLSPMTAGLAIQATTNLSQLPIGPWSGLGVLAAYSTTALLLGAFRFTRCK